MKRQRGRGGRVTLAAMAAMCAVAALPGQSWAAGEPNPYAFDSEAKPVQGSPVNSDGPPLTAGSTYKDTIKPGEKRYYRVDLDAKTNAYISAVAVPKLATKVAYADKLAVSVEDRSGAKCGDDDAMFGSATYARPVAAYADRTIDKESSTCQEAGAYYVLLERSSEATSTPEAWDVEIRFASEPGLKSAAPTAPPESWPSASPAAPAGGPEKRPGGTSFTDATSLKQGEWQDAITPGRTLFYRVPVNWGQQIFASADLGTSATADGTQSVTNAFVLSLYNPARGSVQNESSVYYDGKQKSVALEPLPPVAYENRYDSDNATSAMRFAGWYYLSVTLNPEVGAEFGKKAIPLTLRVNVQGEAKAAPAYAGPAGDFEVTQDDQEAADSGKSAPEVAKSDTMQLVAAAGIGAGTVLVLGLGAWVLLARRRTAALPTPAPFPSPDSFTAQGQAPGQAPGHLPGQVHGQVLGQAPGHGTGQGPGQAPGQASGQYGPPPAW
ncbi:hypothetical protein OG883_32060 [Streptomyces sp. NBC_01142]|uniref:hypothetical protein n=1 Tax=Streptomyces sp. NBC_01142 TaxID=2975865 RepID=UPI002258EBDB|nr:hypothetical protein [Streptomyces sp. NBC_01142]MCX4824410.1 hypothetical protein [Streptomyces sp. NBC_01142]